MDEIISELIKTHSNNDTAAEQLIDTLVDRNSLQSQWQREAQLKVERKRHSPERTKIDSAKRSLSKVERPPTGQRMPGVRRSVIDRETAAFQFAKLEQS